MTALKTPLYDIHVKLGATMVDFAGWQMPIQYNSIVKEHRQVRESVGLFDVSHMGEIEVKGPGALMFCQRILTNDVTKLKPGKVQYNCILNEEGGIIDDCTLYMFHSQHYMLVVNASRKEHVYNWLLLQQETETETEIIDRSDDYALLAVQGKNAVPLVSKLINRNVESITYYEFQICQVMTSAILVSRTGYTGEDGFELYIPPAMINEVWDFLMREGEPFNIQPIGLGARDTLRLEMGYRLYGSDMTEKTSPFEAGLSWIVDMNKGHFIGRQALKDQKEKGIDRRVVGLELLSRGIPRSHCPVWQNENNIGEISSGTFSPTLGKGIALAMLPKSVKFGQTVDIEVRGKKIPAKLVKPPFVQPSVMK